MESLTRRGFLGSALAWLAACGSRGLSGRRPNFVFILADDLGFGHLGCYGQKVIRTPNIDRLAAEGMRFTDAYAGCTVCAPSRSSLMTGQHTGHTPVRGNSGGLPLPASSVTVAELLREAGYTTGGFGKWGLGEQGTEGVPWKQGFDEFVGPLHQVHAQYYYPEFLWRNGEALPLEGNRGGGKGQYVPDVLTDASIDFIRRCREKPFFLYYPSLIPHHEYQAPADSLAEYEGRFPEPEPFIREDRGFEVQHKPAATLAAMITRLDSHVGRIVATLTELGLDDNTIVLFTSDNGAAGSFLPVVTPFAPSGPLRGYKSDLYEGGIRVPAIARWKGQIAAGAVSNHPWAFCDFLPTAMDLAGAPSPDGIDGESIVRTLDGRGQSSERFLYWEAGSGARLQQAVRCGRWKGVRNAPGAALELYDLAADIGERRNVASANGAVVTRMETYLASCRRDPPVLNEPGWRKPVN